jgi:hypothetical protein
LYDYIHILIGFIARPKNALVTPPQKKWKRLQTTKFDTTCQRPQSLHRHIPGANPMTSIYDASAVKNYATSSLVRFESKNIFSYFKIRSSVVVN